MIVTEWASPTSAMGMPVLCSHIARTDALGKKDTRRKRTGQGIDKNDTETPA